MPLKKGYSKASKDANFHELKKSNPDTSSAQRVAIVLSTARKAAVKAGKPPKGPKPPKKSRTKK